MRCYVSPTLSRKKLVKAKEPRDQIQWEWAYIYIEFTIWDWRGLCLVHFHTRVDKFSNIVFQKSQPKNLRADLKAKVIQLRITQYWKSAEIINLIISKHNHLITYHDSLQTFCLISLIPNNFISIISILSQTTPKTCLHNTWTLPIALSPRMTYYYSVCHYKLVPD